MPAMPLQRYIDLPALKSAARAAIVMPAVFAFADGVIQDPDTTLFAAFGSFAILVLARLDGPWRSRLAAYVSLTAAGVVLITLSMSRMAQDVPAATTSETSARSAERRARSGGAAEGPH